MDYNEISNLIRQRQAEGQLEAAITLLLTHIDQFLAQDQWQLCLDLWQTFPYDACQSDPGLLFVEGLIRMRLREFDAAIRCLSRARQGYDARGATERVVRCLLDIARAHQANEDFQTAFLCLEEEVRPLMDGSSVIGPEARARFLQRMATICPDIGRHAAGIEYANSALTAYRQVNDVAGEYETLILLSGLLRQMGEYDVARSRLRQARQIYEVGGVGQRATCYLLNGEAHIHWYLGDFSRALAAANNLLLLVDRENLGNYRVLSRTLLGNLHRDTGNFAEAATFYQKAHAIAQEVGYLRFIPWIDVQMGWLCVLRGDLDAGRQYIHASLATSDRGQAMSFRVVLAALESLEGHYSLADDLLRRSLDFYRRSGDLLAIHAIELHLAYICLHSEQTDLACSHITTAFSWLSEREVDYVPLWWHPRIMGDVCAYALHANLHAELAERILLTHLGERGAAAVQSLLLRAGNTANARLRQVLRLVEGSAYPELNDITNEQIRQTLVTLLEQGRLRADGLCHLRHVLMTAATQQRSNPRILAVFGLYVNGHDRSAIAERLGCAEKTVRNYITEIYQVFGLPQKEWAKQRRARRHRLVELAREQRFI